VLLVGQTMLLGARAWFVIKRLLSLQRHHSLDHVG
jgi:hypothetical protein